MEILKLRNGSKNDCSMVDNINHGHMCLCTSFNDNFNFATSIRIRIKHFVRRITFQFIRFF